MTRPILTPGEYESLVGKEAGISSWVLVDQARIDSFAAVTLDHQSIHVDPVVASRSSFGGTIAHGFLILSLVSAMAQEALPVPVNTQAEINLGFDKLRFVSPVRSGKRVRSRFTVNSYGERSPGLIQVGVAVTVEVEGETKPAIAAQWLVLFQT